MGKCQWGVFNISPSFFFSSFFFNYRINLKSHEIIKVIIVMYICFKSHEIIKEVIMMYTCFILPIHIIKDGIWLFKKED